MHKQHTLIPGTLESKQEGEGLIFFDTQVLVKGERGGGFQANSTGCLLPALVLIGGVVSKIKN